VTPHEGTAFFKTGTRVGGRKDKEEQPFLDIAHVNMSTTN